MRLLSANASSGNAFIEMILFMPLGFAVLFGVADASLYFYEKAEVESAIRAGVNAQVKAFSSFTPEMSLASSSQMTPDSNYLDSVVKAIAANVFESVVRGRGYDLERSGEPALCVRTSAVFLEVDEDTGALTGSSPIFAAETVAGDQDVFSEAGDRSFATMETFVKNELGRISPGDFSERNADGESSLFAISLGGGEAWAGNMGSQVGFAPYAPFIYVEVRARSKSLSGDIARALFGRLYVLQVQGLYSLREATV